VNPRVLLESIVAIALVLPVMSHAQAAAESALTNALSSSTTMKAGSALNHALNQGTTRLGIRIQEWASSPVRVGAPQQIQGAPWTAMKIATAGNASFAGVRSGSLAALGGISVLGGETACTSVSPPNPASPPNPFRANTVPAGSIPGIAPASVDCHGRNSARDSRTGDKYKSFVTLPFPK
jgi:hypothetical protein